MVSNRSKQTTEGAEILSETFVSSQIPPVSALICTRNRAESVVATIESVLANSYPDFEVILIDQSTDHATANASKRFRRDQRFRYVHSASLGKGRALNVGLAHANGQIVVMTDDDCTVPPNFIQVMAEVFDKSAQIAVAFCNVEPAPHNEQEGFIPSYMRQGDKLVRSMWGMVGAIAMGAGMALRRDAIMQMGGFDEYVGPGSVLRSGDDHDIAMRALAYHFWVYKTADVAVVHHGFRTWSQGEELTKRSWFGIGARNAKLLKCRYWSILPVTAYELIGMGIVQPLSEILRRKRLRGLRRLPYFCAGFLQGLRMPVDRRTLVYKAQ